MSSRYKTDIYELGLLEKEIPSSRSLFVSGRWDAYNIQAMFVLKILLYLGTTYLPICMYRKVFMMMVPLGRSCFFLKKKQGKVHLKIGSELFCSMLIKVVQFQLKATLLGVFLCKTSSNVYHCGLTCNNIPVSITL